MTLDEAIIHTKQVAKTTTCIKCKEEHKQLYLWLKELKQYKKKRKTYGK